MAELIGVDGALSLVLANREGWVRAGKGALAQSGNGAVATAVAQEFLDAHFD